MSTTPPHSTTVIKMEVGLSPEPPQSPSPQLTDDNPVYHQRKCMLSEYKDLFSALLRLPDKEIQEKVLNCINASYRSIGTQTNPIEILEMNPSTIKPEITQTNDEKSNVNSEEQNTSPADTCSESMASKQPSPKKRKRKRKSSEPQAYKVSRVAVAKKQQMAKLSKPLHQQQAAVVNLNNDHIFDNFDRKNCRKDSCDFSDNSSFINGIFDDMQKEETRSREHLFQIFIKDCLLAEIPLENGLLPIQDSLIKNQPNNLNRQIFIWKDWKKADLNEILTDDGEDLLQLCIAHHCLPSIAKVLLEKGLNPCSVDDQGNTLLHLAVMHDIDKRLLKQVMEHIDLKMLLTFNDEGYTSLHLAVRKNCYLLAECMLNTLDKRLSGNQFYKRDDNLETDDEVIKRQFHEYYEKVCMQMEVDDENGPPVIKNHEQKQQLLQTVDMRSGNTPLFFALENKSEHLVYFLLAHLTDPRTENFSGQDCKSFFSEYCKTLNISLNIDNTMEKVIQLLS